MMRFHLDEQIAAQPEAVRRVLEGDAPPVALDPGRPLLLTGEGTSLHAARVAAAWVGLLSAGAVRAHAVEAHSLALDGSLRAADQVVVVSHRGTKRFPLEVLECARAAGASTVCVTGAGAAEVPADLVIRTCPDETSATHTVSYLAALAVLARLVTPLGARERAAAFAAALETVPDALAAALAEPAPTGPARRLAARAPILVAGFDLEAVTADEAALKIKEGAYTWAEGMSVEAALHGPVAAYGPAGAAIVIAPPWGDGGRTEALAGVCAAVGMDVLRCGPAPDADLVLPELAPWVRPLVSIVPLQRVVAELARLRGTNPDTIRTHEEPWAGAMKRVRL